MTDYSKLKVAELKDLIKERGIASTGLKVKQQYVDALVADDEGKGGEEGVKEDAGEPEQVEETAEDATVDEPVDEAMDNAASDEVGTSRDATLESSEESTNKRKRRSPTPPMSEESINKKIKTAGESGVDVKLPEDVMTDTPAPMDEGSEMPPKDEVKEESKDEAMDVREEDTKAQTDSHQQDSDQPAKDDATLPDAEPSALPSKHPVTRALYIRDLVRPLQPGALRDHLLSVAQRSGDATIEEFHLDKLRTHAFVLFDSVSAASAVRNALHDQVWPDEPMRKPLWVDYVPEDKVREWIDVEVTKNDLTRWEVVYISASLDTDGPVIASLQEAETGTSQSRNMAGSSRQAPGTGEGMPNAPSGPRRRSTQYQPPPQRQSKTNDILDEMYPFTQTKPKIYYQPVPRELVEKRLDEFEKEKSRDWDDRFADPAAYAEGELRRYTFEDGDRLVDGGADFGLFGRNPRGGMRGGGRGRGRGGDRYRGAGGRR